jgi:hypothetical protein
MLATIRQAQEIHVFGGWTRVFLEARALSRAPTSEIATKMGLPVNVVAAYIRHYYNVADLLPYKSRVVSQLIRPADAECEDQIVESFVKRIAYSGGSRMLDVCLATVEPLLPGPFAERLADLTTVRDLVDLKMRRLLAVELAAKDKFGHRVLEYLRRQLKPRDCSRLPQTSVHDAIVRETAAEPLAEPRRSVA